MYESELKELGLTDNEARIYLALLQSGAANPSLIAEKLGLHRGYVYDALDRLAEKGIVNTVLINNKQHYQATSPDNLVELLHLKLETIESIVPGLNKLASIAETDTLVELHEGERVYRTLLKDIISSTKKNEEVLLIGIDEALLDRLEPIYRQQYFTILSEKNIKERIIIKKGAKAWKHPRLQYRELDSSFIGNTAQIIYGDNVALFILGTPLHLVIIQNLDVANTYRKQFGVLWKLAK